MSSWRDDLNYGLAAFGLRIPERLSLDDLTAKLDASPGKSIAQVIAAASAVFYLAERGCNPRVKSLLDAALFCSSLLNVGETGIRPMTPLGKLVATLLMTYGPALAQRAMDRPAHSELPSGDDNQQAILQTLRDILARLPAPASSA